MSESKNVDVGKSETSRSGADLRPSLWPPDAHRVVGITGLRNHNILQVETIFKTHKNTFWFWTTTVAFLLYRCPDYASSVSVGHGKIHGKLNEVTPLRCTRVKNTILTKRSIHSKAYTNMLYLVQLIWKSLWWIKLWVYRNSHGVPQWIIMIHWSTVVKTS